MIGGRNASARVLARLAQICFADAKGEAIFSISIGMIRT